MQKAPAIALIGLLSCTTTFEDRDAAHVGIVEGILCTGEGLDEALVASFHVRQCALERNRIPRAHTPFGICVTDKPFVCPGLKHEVAECASYPASVYVSKTYPCKEYDFLFHLRLGVLNHALRFNEVWIGEWHTEEELRSYDEYFELIECMRSKQPNA